jgi:hypothetical protein
VADRHATFQLQFHTATAFAPARQTQKGNRMNRNGIIDPPGIVRNVEALAEQINAEHHQVETALRTGLEHAKRAGELLIQAKEQCRHGEWTDWIEANVHFSERTAQRYMSIASRWEELAKTTRVANRG